MEKFAVLLILLVIGVTFFNPFATLIGVLVGGIIGHKMASFTWKDTLIKVGPVSLEIK